MNRTLESLLYDYKASKSEAALLELLERFEPLISKYSFKLSQDYRTDFIILCIECFQKMPLLKEPYIVNYIANACKNKYIQLSKSNEHLQNKLVYIDEYPEFEFISDPHSNIADLVETRNLVNSLSPLEKNIVILKVFFDLSDLEISKKYNFSRQYIQKTKDRAYQKLREHYA